MNLAQDLIAFYDLGMNDGQLLRNKISSYIEWPKKYTREVIEARFAEHGRELAEVIDFVRRMLSAKIWYDTSTMKVRYWHDILFSKLIDDKGLIKQGTACDFFGFAFGSICATSRSCRIPHPTCAGSLRLRRSAGGSLLHIYPIRGL